MNKYEDLAIESRQKRIKSRSCDRKKKFSSRNEAIAHNKNQTEYQCKFCGGWHLSGSLIQQVKISRALARNHKAIERAFNE